MDDGSTDESVEIVHSYDDPRIRLLQNHHDYIGTINRLLYEGKGDFIARMDADDVMVPDRLEVQLDYRQNNAVSSDFEFQKFPISSGGGSKLTIKLPTLISII